MADSGSSEGIHLDAFNIFDPEVQQCPHMYYALMREETAAYETRAMGGSLFLITRQEDVAEAALKAWTSISSSSTSREIVPGVSVIELA